VVPYSPEKLQARIATMLQNPPANIQGKIVDNHIILDIVGDEVHYWSPHLNFRIEEDDSNPSQCHLLGLIGPRPGVWTLFMFIYFVIGIIGFGISSYGISKWMLGEATFYLWGFPIALFIMLSAYKAGKYGEQLGKDQIEVLKQFIRDAIAPE